MVCQQGQGLEPCGRRVSLRRNRRNDAERNDAQRLAAGAAAVGMGVERCKPCKFCAHPFLPKEGLGTYTLYASLCPCAYIYIYIHINTLCKSMIRPGISISTQMLKRLRMFFHVVGRFAPTISSRHDRHRSPDHPTAQTGWNGSFKAAAAAAAALVCSTL